MKHRLSRLGKIYQENPIYFITACAHDRKCLLATPEIDQTLRTFCLEAEQRNYLVGRYVLMPDHLHFFVCPNPEQELSLWIKSLKNALSKTLRQLGHQAPHWQKGFFDHLMRSGNSYSAKWEYVRHNPVRHGLVENADDWPYQGEIVVLPFV